MLKKISLSILFLNILASPTFAGGFNRDSNHQVNLHRQGLFFKNNFDTSTRAFQNRNFKYREKSPDKSRIPKFIGLPFYGVNVEDSYERGEKEVVNIIVEGNKKDETTNVAAKNEKPIAPPHIVTLDDKESRNGLNPSGGKYRVVEIRGNKVSVAAIERK
jgi:hypothetical protein